MAVAASHAAAVQAKALATLADISLEDEYTELLSTEESIDVPKLQELASLHGVPNQYRSLVWSYLLGILPADRSHEQSSAKIRAVSYDTTCTSALASHMAPEFMKSISVQYSRYLRRDPTVAKQIIHDRPVIERILTTFLCTHSQFSYVPAYLRMLLPFVACIGTEHEAYFCFEAFMLKLVDQSHPPSQQMSDFLALLRTHVPEVHNYIEEEQVDVRDFLPNWIQYHFCMEMQFPTTLRLYDSYIADTTASYKQRLHPFVCLAVLHVLKETLEELEASEAVAVLNKLPFTPTDLQNVLHIANNLRLDVSECDNEFYCGAGSSLSSTNGYVTSR